MTYDWILDWLERWPQYADTVPDEIRLAHLERKTSAIVDMIADVSSRTVLPTDQVMRACMLGMQTPPYDGAVWKKDRDDLRVDLDGERQRQDVMRIVDPTQFGALVSTVRR